MGIPTPATAPPGACGRCGFRPETVTPPDAIVAVRSLGRRWRELMEGFSPEEDRQALLAVRVGGGWSALEHAAHVADVFARQAQQLRQIRERIRPLLDHGGMGASGAYHGTGEVEDVVADLTASAEFLAQVAQSIAGEDWQRTGTRSGGEVTALDLLREAVHEGIHHLREASEDLAALRAQTAHRRGRR